MLQIVQYLKSTNQFGNLFQQRSFEVFAVADIANRATNMRFISRVCDFR